MYKIEIPEREIEEGDKKGESRTRIDWRVIEERRLRRTREVSKI